MGSLFSLPWDFVKGEFDLIANKNVSYLAKYLYYTSKNITLEVTDEMDKASQDVSIFCKLYLFSPSFVPLF